MRFEDPVENGAPASAHGSTPATSTGASADPAQPTAHTPHADGRSLRRRARLRGWKLPITDGPFAESKEL